MKLTALSNSANYTKFGMAVHQPVDENGRRITEQTGLSRASGQLQSASPTGSAPLVVNDTTNLPLLVTPEGPTGPQDVAQARLIAALQQFPGSGETPAERQAWDAEVTRLTTFLQGDLGSRRTPLTVPPTRMTQAARATASGVGAVVSVLNPLNWPWFRRP